MKLPDILDAESTNKLNPCMQVGVEHTFDNGIKNIVDQILVPHTAVENAINRITRCFITAKGSQEPVCISVIGPSRTGKTRVFNYIESKNPRYRLDDGLIVPILKVTTPSNPTVKGLAEVLLHKLGDPTPGKGTEVNMTSRLIKLLEKVQTRMIIVDEFQHFYDKQSHKVMHHVADWLKTVIDDSKVSLVVGGLPTCQAVLNQNEQLSGRFLGQLVMPRFDWENDDSRTEFIGILEAFQGMLTDYEMPKLDSDEMAFRFYCATGGLIGYIVKILRQAIWNAMFEETKVISLDSLKIAYQESVYVDESSKGLLPVFDRGFITKATTDLLERVKMIGVKAPEIELVRRSKKSSEKLTTNQVLAAS